MKESNNLPEEKYIPRHASTYGYDKVKENIELDSEDTSSDEELEVEEKCYKIDKNIDIEKELDNINDTIEPKVVKKKKRKLKRWVWIFFLIIFICIIIFSSIKIILWMKDNKETSDTVNNINKITNIKEKKDDENTELVNEPEDKSKENDYWYYIKFPLIDVDINALKSKNSDTIGWINVNNTNINYPYVQGKDNSYYLTHSYDKSYNEAGWVFLDYRNSSALSDKNNILYAHSRLDKTMFGSLSKTLKSNWYNNKDNHIIRLSTESENTMWQIFSVYKIPEESYYITTNFNTDSEYETFLNTIKERSIHNFNTTLTVKDKILTLSTCYSDTERTVVHAKLIKRSSR